MAGGRGGYGQQGAGNAPGGAGGAGYTGVNGGAGAQSGGGGGGGAGGGRGGNAGLFPGSGATVAGGAGADNQGGGGGGGTNGRANGSLLGNNSANITAQAGGSGGSGYSTIVNGNSVGTGGGGGGAGGYGIVAGDATGATVSNAGAISGGAGGQGGAGGARSQGGAGGAGGIGVQFQNSGVTLLNTNAITGGAGGAAGANGAGNNGQVTNGFGGAGVIGSNLSVTNTGTITGGMSGGATPVRADAITFTGGTDNELVLTSASRSADGGLVGDIGVRGTLEINRDGSGSGSTTLTSVIHDFDDGVAGNSDAGSLRKTGTGTLTLSAANTYSGGTEIREGTLAVSADNNLGAAAGGVTLNRGTLEATSSFTSNRTVTLLGGGGAPDVIAVDANATLNLTGMVTASGQDGGPLIKRGSGNLVLSGSASLVEGGSVAAGTLTTAGNVDTNGSAFSIEQGAVIDLVGTDQSKLTVFLNGGTIRNGSAAYITTQDIGDGTISGVTGATRVELAGDTTFFTDDTYTGTTLIEDRTNTAVARATAENAFSAASVTSIGRNGTLDLGGFDQTIDVFRGGQLGSGTITNSGTSTARLTTGGVSATASFAGVIQDGGNGGSLSLAKVGTGTLTLSGANAYGGGTTLAGGTVELGQLTSAGTGNITFGAGAQTLRLDTTGTLGNRIDDLGLGDAIDLQTIARNGAILNTSTAGNVTTLTVSDGTDTNKVMVENAASGFRYALGSDADSATIILEAIPSNPPTPTGPTPQADNLTGTGAADTISLLAGADRYSGLGGNDLIYGNQGNDTLYGNEGADTVYGGQNNDRIIGGQDNDRLYGNLGNDRLYGNNGNDRLFGGQGNDYLVGGEGADILVGGLGNDILIGGAGADRYVFAPDPGAVDLIRGFSTAEGDRLDLGGQDYTVRYAGDGDAILTLSGGGQVRLDGVTQQEFAQGGLFVG